MTDINLETVTRALVNGASTPDDPFEGDEVYWGDAKHGRMDVTWFDTDSNATVSFTVTVSDLVIEDVYPSDYDEEE